MTQIFGYPWLSWVPILSLLVALILDSIDSGRKKNDHLSAIYKITVGLCVFSAAALAFLLGWQERWLALFLCALVADKFFNGLKLLKSLKLQTKQPD